jgi:hypothetical protein
MAVVGDENAGCAPASPNREQQMQKQQRRRFKQIDPLDKRLAEEAERLRNEAEGTPGH